MNMCINGDSKGRRMKFQEGLGNGVCAQSYYYCDLNGTFINQISFNLLSIFVPFHEIMVSLIMLLVYLVG